MNALTVAAWLAAQSFRGIDVAIPERPEGRTREAWDEAAQAWRQYRSVRVDGVWVEHETDALGRRVEVTP